MTMYPRYTSVLAVQVKMDFSPLGTRVCIQIRKKKKKKKALKWWSVSCGVKDDCVVSKNVTMVNLLQSFPLVSTQTYH